MDFIEKISLKESSEKEKNAVLYDNELTDDQKVILYNEILKKTIVTNTIQNENRNETFIACVVQYWKHT